MQEGWRVANDGFRLFVGDMGSRMTESELLAVFKPFGAIKSVRVVRDRVTGSSAGYAFVEIIDRDGAKRAVSKMNGKRIDGHCLVVRPLF